MRKLCVTVVVALLAASVVTVAGSGSSSATPRWKVWLCRPGLAVDWCNVDMRTTLIAANGKQKIDFGPPPAKRPIDCFYAYPSIPGNTTDMKIEEEEKRVAIIQASRFGQACRVFAPMYRQSPGETAYRDVLTAWRDYLAHYNKGRGFALIGHSQGAYILQQLIAEEIEGSPALRSRLVSAILLGSSVTVAKGSDTGGTFKRIPACRKAGESGCVVAYSTWGRTPPKSARFEDVDGPDRQVLCVNPAAPAGGSAPITPLFPWFAPEGIVMQIYQVKTLWVSLPGKYKARCVTSGSRAWLLIENVGPVGDKRELASEVLAPGWGLHAADVNIALPQLVELVRAQAKAWARTH